MRLGQADSSLRLNLSRHTFEFLTASAEVAAPRARRALQMQHSERTASRRRGRQLERDVAAASAVGVAAALAVV